MNNGHNNIILIGFMGSGKTTFGKWITRNHNMEFIDTDELLEITPENLRIRKKILDPTLRKRANIRKNNK